MSNLSLSEESDMNKNTIFFNNEEHDIDVKIDTLNFNSWNCISELDEWLVQPLSDQPKFCEDHTDKIPSEVEEDTINNSDEENKEFDDDEDELVEDGISYSESAFKNSHVYKDPRELIDWCKSEGIKYGFVIVVGRSNTNQNNRTPRWTLTCERSGSFRKFKSKHQEDTSKKKVSRKSGTKKCNCPFKLQISQNISGGWFLNLICGTHNHPVSDNLVGHAYVGRLTLEEQQLIIQLSMAGAKPRVMLSLLKQRNPKNMSTLRTIYNFRSKHRLLELQGRTQMQQLLKCLEEGGYTEFHKSNEESGHCTDLFFAHPDSIKLANIFPEVLVIDCTYKTNLHRLPLLEVVGFTSTLKTFAICFAYLHDETEDRFRWALDKVCQILGDNVSKVRVILTDRDLALCNAVVNTFPEAQHLLCRWHIEKNILSKAKKCFKERVQYENFMAMVGELIKSATMEEYSENVLKMRRIYGMFGDVVEYVEQNWLNPYRQKFVSVWTDQFRHFGTHTTNRAESMHASLKRHLESSRGNLVQNWSTIENLLSNQVNEIQRTFILSRNNPGHRFSDPIFSELRGFIAREALDLISEELQREKFIGDSKEKCLCSLRITQGLPCAHELSEYVQYDGIIPISVIDSRWRKLDMISRIDDNNPEDISPELEAIRRVYDTLNKHEKHIMRQKLLELAYPSTTLMREPVDKVNTKGRPSGVTFMRPTNSVEEEIDHSTTRFPSSFESAQCEQEIVESEKLKENASKKRGRPRKDVSIVFDLKDVLNKKNAETKVHPMKDVSEDASQKNAKKRGRPPKQKAARVPINLDVDITPEKWKKEMGDILPVIRDHVEYCEQVRGDGHCGFRAIAKLRGYDDETGWQKVRKELLDELEANKTKYTRQFPSDGFDINVQKLKCVDKTTATDWFDLPDMGWLTANTYKCIFVVVHPTQSLIYLPLWIPPPKDTIPMIEIAHVWKDTHFVPMRFQSASPLPPIAPGYYHICEDIALEWGRRVEDRMLLWAPLTAPMNANYVGVEPTIEKNMVNLVDDEHDDQDKQDAREA